MIPWLRLLPPTSTFLLTAPEGTLQGHKTGTHLMETKRQVRERENQAETAERCCKRRGTAWQVDIC